MSHGNTISPLARSEKDPDNFRTPFRGLRYYHHQSLDMGAREVDETAFTDELHSKLSDDYWAAAGKAMGAVILATANAAWNFVVAQTTAHPDDWRLGGVKLLTSVDPGFT